jgi:RHS repeat-associated protein
MHSYRFTDMTTQPMDATVAAGATAVLRSKKSMKRSRVSMLVGLCLSWTLASAEAARLPGQTATLLPDGSTLLLGGRGTAGALSAAAVEPAGGTETPLPSGLGHARYGHTATVLPNGTVLVLGGVGGANRLETVAELFDPRTRQFRDLSPTGLTARVYHSATLLTDGRVLVAGGRGADGATLGLLETWDFRTNAVSTLSWSLLAPRSRHTSRLLPDGSDLVWGGVDAVGATLGYGEAFDPQRMDGQLETALPAAAAEPPQLEASLPAHGAVDVSPDTLIALRFSKPLRVTSVTARSVRLSGPSGTLATTVVPAEGGMLAFVMPRGPLAAGTTYNVSLSGLTDGTAALLDTTFFFTTASSTQNRAADDDPSEDTGKQALSSHWRKLPPLKAPAGVTALAGQALRLNGEPLRDLTLSIGAITTRTDSTGRFLLTGIPAGHQVILINGKTAANGKKTYGMYEVGEDILAGRTNVLWYTMWMTAIDIKHATTIPSPTTAEDTIVTTANLPGLSLHLPLGSLIYDHDWKVTDTVSITSIPVDRPPFPLPVGVNVPIYFTVQPGAGYVRVRGAGYKGARLIYPNTFHGAPGAVYDFWDYDADGRGWFVYGHGRVSADAATIVPDPGVEIHELTGAMVATASQAASTGPSHCCEGGDPVDLGTGIFVYENTDLSLRDVLPVSLTRTYRQNDSASRAFGIGATHPYDIFLLGDRGPYTYAQLVLPDGQRIHYDRTSSGTGYADAVYESASTPGKFFGSTIVWRDPEWLLTLKDGTTYRFIGSSSATTPQGNALLGIRDAHGNQVTILRGATGSNISQILSPNGRWLKFTYDGSNRITQLEDNIGRTVSYTYDGTGRLSSVTDPGGGVTSYTYDSSHRMLTVTDPRSHVHVTNEYTNGRVTKQTMADGGIFEFSYTVDVNGDITQVDVTDPRGNVRRVAFNAPPSFANGYKTGGMPSSETRAYGTADAQTTSYTWQSGTNLLLSETDALSRTTAYTYDSGGNPASVTRLYGTGNAVTTSFTYDFRFNKLATVTDPLSHVTTLAYDFYGNLASITDALGHATTFTYTSAGQLASTCDALTNCTQYAYDGGDLVSTTDPLSRTTSSFVDAVGRVVSSTNPLGQTALVAYDALDRTTTVTDPLGGQTAFTYDANGSMLTLTDANSHVTEYTYDDLERVLTHKDPLLNQDSTQYDVGGKVTQVTDRRGKVTTYTYDDLDRMTFAGFGTQSGPTYESTVTYTYDAGNRMTQAVDSIAGTITRAWDGLDRMTSEISSTGTVTYTYDAADRRATLNVSGQSQVSYTYDNAGRMTQMTQGTSTVSFAYDSVGRRTSLTLPNGVSVSYGYDGASQLTDLTYANGGTTLGTLTHTYDSNGSRLTRGGTYARTGLPTAVGTTAYNADNRVTTWGSSSLTYDANGNLTSDGTHTYSWDARNHVTSMDAGTHTFVYDPFGRRQSKAISGTSTTFLYDGLAATQELIGGTNSANSLMGGVDEVFQRTDSSGARTFLLDGLGSTLALADSTPTVQTEYTYEPFGATTTIGSGTTNSFAFTGRESDGTGLYYYRARYYSPTLARFISEDPIAAGDNLYSYASNSPAVLTDPLGLVAASAEPVAPTRILPPPKPLPGPPSAGPRAPMSEPAPSTGTAPSAGAIGWPSIVNAIALVVMCPVELAGPTDARKNACWDAAQACIKNWAKNEAQVKACMRAYSRCIESEVTFTFPDGTKVPGAN